MALVTNATLNAMRVGFNKVFEQGKARAKPQYLQVATVVPSTTKSKNKIIRKNKIHAYKCHFYYSISTFCLASPQNECLRFFIKTH